MRIFLSHVVLFITIGAAFAQPTEIDVVYGPDSLQKFDVYNADKPNSPIVIAIHGGGWRAGNKEDANWMEVSQMFNDSGYAVINTNYRLSSQNGYIGFPAQIQDIICVISWVKQNSDLINGDSSKIVLFGHSAGAHLATLVSLWDTNLPSECLIRNSTSVHSVIALAGAYSYDVMPSTNKQVVYDMLIDTANWCVSQPISHINSKYKPNFLIIHGKNDRVVGDQQGELFFNSLINKNFCVEFHLLNRGHGLMQNPLNDSIVFNKVFKFLQKVHSNSLCQL